MENTRRDRVLEIFFRGLRGEDLCVQNLAAEYEVSTKSITRMDTRFFMSLCMSRLVACSFFMRSW